MYCTVLSVSVECTVLYCTVLSVLVECTVLYCTVSISRVYCTVLSVLVECTVLYCTVLYCHFRVFSGHTVLLYTLECIVDILMLNSFINLYKGVSALALQSGFNPD